MTGVWTGTVGTTPSRVLRRTRTDRRGGLPQTGRFPSSPLAGEVAAQRSMGGKPQAAAQAPDATRLRRFTPFPTFPRRGGRGAGGTTFLSRSPSQTGSHRRPAHAKRHPSSPLAGEVTAQRAMGGKPQAVAQAFDATRLRRFTPFPTFPRRGGRGAGGSAFLFLAPSQAGCQQRPTPAKRRPSSPLAGEVAAQRAMGGKPQAAAQAFDATRLRRFTPFPTFPRRGGRGAGGTSFMVVAQAGNIRNSRERYESMADNRARALRANLTPAERRLWQALRRQQVADARFRRQVPIGPYIADFCCLKHRLVIEIDGGQHAQRTTTDERRSQWLESQGFTVIRFWNNEVLSNLEGVLVSISRICTRGARSNAR